MQTLLIDLKKHAISQLDSTVRLANVNCTFVERLISTQVTVAVDAIRLLVEVQHSGNCGPVSMPSVMSKSILSYCNFCMRDGFAYQQEILKELSRRSND